VAHAVNRMNKDRTTSSGFIFKPSFAVVDSFSVGQVRDQTSMSCDGEVDLALEFTHIIMAEAAYGANAEVLRTTEEMERQFINVIA